MAQLCSTICDPLQCSPPASSVHGVLQARTLECVAVLFSREFSQPRDWAQVSRMAGGFFTIRATREALWPEEWRISTKRVALSSFIILIFLGFLSFHWKKLNLGYFVHVLVLEIWFHSVSCQTYSVPCVMVLYVLSVAFSFPQMQSMCLNVLTILSPPDSTVSYLPDCKLTRVVFMSVIIIRVCLVSSMIPDKQLVLIAYWLRIWKDEFAVSGSKNYQWSLKSSLH